MRFAGTSGRIAVYRIGLGRDAHELRLALSYGQWSKATHRLGLMLKSATRRSWWGLWQAEWDNCQRAPRGLTRQRAFRKALHQVYDQAIYVAATPLDAEVSKP